MLDIPSDMSRLSDFSHEHHREMLEAAKIVRLLRPAEADQPGLRDRLLLAGGGALIALGQKLRAYACQRLVVPCESVYQVKSALPRS